MPRMLDLFCGRWGWSRAFAARGWECVGVDLVEPPEIPNGCIFWKRNALSVDEIELVDACGTRYFDFVCASSPCEEFSKFGMACFYPDPPYPATGIELFNHTRKLLWSVGIPWVMENVNPAQKFVGPATDHAGPFYLWGTGVPPLLPENIRKGRRLGTSGYKAQFRCGNDLDAARLVATIPPELANCVAEYAERLLEQKSCAGKEK